MLDASSIPTLTVSLPDQLPDESPTGKLYTLTIRAIDGERQVWQVSQKVQEDLPGVRCVEIVQIMREMERLQLVTPHLPEANEHFMHYDTPTDVLAAFHFQHTNRPKWERTKERFSLWVSLPKMIWRILIQHG